MPYVKFIIVLCCTLIHSSLSAITRIDYSMQDVQCSNHVFTGKLPNICMVNGLNGYHPASFEYNVMNYVQATSFWIDATNPNKRLVAKLPQSLQSGDYHQL